MVIDNKDLEYNNWMLLFTLRDALFLFGLPCRNLELLLGLLIIRVNKEKVLGNKDQWLNEFEKLLPVITL